MNAAHSHILLIGGGHAHVAVLADWIKNGRPCERATLLTPHQTLRYSGMVPGWISGQYDRDAGLVDLAALAERAGAELVLDSCTAIDPDKSEVSCASGKVLSFGVASIDTGGVGRARDILGDDPRLIDVRPIDGFVEQLSGFETARSIAVIGGGAGGVELAFALNNRAGLEQADIALVTGAAGLLPDHSSAVQRKAAAELARQNVHVIEADAALTGGKLTAGGMSMEPVDLIVAALGSGAPDWPAQSGLSCDPAGFIAVDRHQRSPSHPHIFAAGDIAARLAQPIPHSGVHAVMAGPVLAANLRAAMTGHAPRLSYHPRRARLYLLSTARGEAITSFGPFAAQGRWAAKLKHAIDTRWITKYAKLARAV